MTKNFAAKDISASTAADTWRAALESEANFEKWFATKIARRLRAYDQSIPDRIAALNRTK